MTVHLKGSWLNINTADHIQSPPSLHYKIGIQETVKGLYFERTRNSSGESSQYRKYLGSLKHDQYSVTRYHALLTERLLEHYFSSHN